MVLLLTLLLSLLLLFDVAHGVAVDVLVVRVCVDVVGVVVVVDVVVVVGVGVVLFERLRVQHCPSRYAL